MRTLQAALRRQFVQAAPRKPDVHRKDREWAKPVAAEYGIEIERIGTGFNVWPPKALFEQGRPDMHDGDHYCGNWAEVAVMVKEYAHQLGRTD